MKYIYALLVVFISLNSTAQNWNKKTLIKGAVCSDIIQLNSGKLIALSTDGVYASSDMAANWAKISADMDVDLSNYVNDVEPEALYLSNDTVYAYFRSKLFVSTNEGLNWQAVNTSSVRPAYETTFAIRNPNLYLTKLNYTTNLSTIYISKNAGATWETCDTITAKVNLFKHQNDVYVWGYTGSLWGVKNVLLKKLDSNNKLTSVPTAGLPANTDIRGMGAAGNNLILMIPEYNQGSAIIATRLYGFNGQSWVQGSSFTENYSKLYSVGEFCFHPFFNSTKVLRTRDGLTWTNVPASELYGYYSSIRKVSANKILASSRIGIFELDTNFNKLNKSDGMYAGSFGDFVSFKQKLFLNSSESGLYFSTDNGQSFTSVGAQVSTSAQSIKASTNFLYAYNPYLMPKDKIFITADGSIWDTLVMPAGNFSQRQVLMVSDNGVWMSVTESNVKSYKFYNDQTKNWSDVSSAVPSSASYFNTYNSTNGNMVVFNTYYENNIKKTSVYQIENNASVWKLLKHSMGDIWYENTSVYNNNFYILKNAYNNPDSLFKIRNDSVVFEKVLKYGNYKFYTESYFQSFIYRGNDIYCLGYDTTQQYSLTIIRSIDGGLTWAAFNNGLSYGTQVKSLHFNNSILASTNKGIYEYGATSSFVQQLGVEYSTVYPNPANESIYIKSANAEIVELSIFNINGMEIYKESANEKMMHLDVSDLDSGLYFFKIKTSRGVESKKIVIQH